MLNPEIEVASGLGYCLHCDPMWEARAKIGKAKGLERDRLNDLIRECEVYVDHHHPRCVKCTILVGAGHYEKTLIGTLCSACAEEGGDHGNP